MQNWLWPRIPGIFLLPPASTEKARSFTSFTVPNHLHISRQLNGRSPDDAPVDAIVGAGGGSAEPRLRIVANAIVRSMVSGRPQQSSAVARLRARICPR